MSDLRVIVPANWPGGVRAAITLSRAMALAREDRGLSQAERDRLAREYGKAALGWLEPLARQGLPELGDRLDGPELASLRGLFVDEVRQLKEVWQRASPKSAGDQPGR